MEPFMPEAEIIFEREGIEGILPVGSYIGDAIRRFGVHGYERCSEAHDCSVTVTRGEDLLSPLTQIETEHFAGTGRKTGERLACQARIERPGEIVVMTQEKQEAPKPDETKSDQYRKEFAEMPLEEKIAELMKLEAIAFGETFSFILNSPFKVFEKVGDVMAEFGMKLEDKAKQAQRPAEHAANETAGKSKTRHKKEKPKKEH
jgi:ferredoxin